MWRFWVVYLTGPGDVMESPKTDAGMPRIGSVDSIGELPAPARGQGRTELQT